MNLISLVKFFFIIIIISILPFGFISYTGNKFYYLIFSAISSYALISSFNKDSISFESFFALLIWLGFWFKFTVQISLFNSLFPEGTGIFDYSSNSYDQILVISSVSILAFISAKQFRLRFIFNYQNEKINGYDYKDYLTFYFKYRKLIFFTYLFSIIFFATINLIYIFFQKGTIPVSILPFGLNNFINWLLMFGLASFSSLLIFFEFQLKKKNSNKLIKFGLLETFVSSISILSRAMIFNGTSIIYGFYRLIELNNFKIKISAFIKYLMIILVLFMTSLLIVSKLRQGKNFPIGHEVHKYIPMIEFDPNVKTSKKVEKIMLIANDLSKELNQIIFLVAGRWVGIEGVMAVYGNKELNLNSLLLSFKDEFDYSNSFYENVVKRSKHIYKKDPEIFTVYVPGIVAFLFYSKSLILLFCMIFLLCIFCSIVEYFAFRMSKGNVIFSYLIGNILAYRLAHFGYMPQNSYKLILAIFITIFLIHLGLKAVKFFNNN
jgi:hypothetical protein